MLLAAGRLASDPGDVDPALDPGIGPNSLVVSLALQADGKVVIGGPFTSVSGTAQNQIARLHADGTLDTSFDPGRGVASGLEAVAVQPDGKVLLCGSFSSVNGVICQQIARLNAGGGVDLGFELANGADNPIHTMVMLGDGRVLVGGFFCRHRHRGPGWNRAPPFGRRPGRKL